MTTYAVNGLGRIGKLALRALLERGARIAWINDAVGSPAIRAHLLEFDTVHGRWNAAISFKSTENSIIVDGQEIKVTAIKNPAELPWKESGVSLVLESTGVFRKKEQCMMHVEAGARKVLLTVPPKDAVDAIIVMGVNEDTLKASDVVVSNASCTTNCLAPVVKVIHDSLGIRHGAITTIHDVTNTQTIADRPAKDLRRARSALNSLIPTTTGSATAIALIYPELKGRLNGHAVRVPLLNASLTDCVFEVGRPTTAEEVNHLFKAAAAGPLNGILGFEERPLVSADYTNDRRSCIIDAPSTMVVNGTQVKVFAWYDNEMGYAHRLADVALMVGRSL